MIKAQDHSVMLNKAVRAMRKAVKNVIAERKLRGLPLIIWRNGRIVKIPPSQL